MVNANFIDIDAIVSVGAKAWIVDKKNPSIPIMKITKSDFNLYQNGIFRKQGNKIDFNGKTFWLPTDVTNKLKIKVKNHKSNFSDLAISLQEFLNKDVIDNLEFDLNELLLNKLKNTTDDIYIICSKQTKLSHQSIIDKIEDKLKKEGLKIKNFYFISETFYNRNMDEVEFKKMRLLIQHLVGYKTSGNKFIDEEITRYDQIEYYDNNLDTIKVANQTNDLLKLIWKNSDEGLRSVIKEDIEQYKPQLVVNQIGDNQVNQISTEKIKLSISNLVKTFEGFSMISEGYLKIELEKYYSNIEDIKDYLIDLEEFGDEVEVDGKPGNSINPFRNKPNYYNVTISSVKSDIEDRINWSRMLTKFELIQKRLRRLKMRGRNNVFEMTLKDKGYKY
jgi:hypothetical protein